MPGSPALGEQMRNLPHGTVLETQPFSPQKETVLKNHCFGFPFLVFSTAVSNKKRPL